MAINTANLFWGRHCSTSYSPTTGRWQKPFGYDNGTKALTSRKEMPHSYWIIPRFGSLILPLILLAIISSVSAAQLPAVASFAGNAQHTAIYQVPSQNLNTIHWSTTIDFNNSGAQAHYGAPLISSANTVIVPVKTANNGFQVEAFDGATGGRLFSISDSYAHYGAAGFWAMAVLCMAAFPAILSLYRCLSQAPGPPDAAPPGLR